MKHRVFLSSTYTDLADYRAAVQLGLRQLGALDVSMENFGARDEQPVDECVRIVRQESDLFVGVYAHKYGYVPDGTDVSISELEYRAASEASLPRFIYLVDEQHPWRPSQIDQGVKAERLKSFKDGLGKRHICQQFGGKDELAMKVVADIGRHIAMHNAPRVGPGIPIEHIGMESMPQATTAPSEWNVRRNAVYAEHRNIFLTHVISPSAKPGQMFDVFIYLVRHKSTDFSDIRYAEFFLGPYWENKVFPAVERNGFIGLATSAFGTFLCLCKLIFKDGSEVQLERYIDFEAQRTGGAAAV
jgi:hypothetical protein